MLSKKLIAATESAPETINVVGYSVTNSTSIYLPQTSTNQLVVIYSWARNSTTTLPTKTIPSGFTLVKTYAVNASNRAVRMTVSSRYGSAVAGSVSGVRGTGAYSAAIALILERPSNPFTSNYFNHDTGAAWYSDHTVTSTTTITSEPPITNEPSLMLQFACKYAMEASGSVAADSGFGTSVRVTGTQSDVSVIFYESPGKTQKSIRAFGSSAMVSVLKDYIY